MKKILVTGGAGFLGSHIVEIFLKKGFHVNIIDDFSTGKLKNLKSFYNSKKLKVFKGSIGNKKILLKSIFGCEGVIHCATKNVRYSIQNPIDTHAVNSEYTIKLLNLSLKKKIKKFIYCSSSEIYGNCTYKTTKLKEVENYNPSTVYGATKLAGEYYARVYRDLYKLNLIIIRPFNLFGERAHLEGDSAEVISRFFVNIIKKKNIYIFGNGKNSRDFTYVKDAADIFFKIYSSKSKFKIPLINLGYGKNFSVNEVFRKISKILNNKKIKPKYIKKRPGDVKNLICDNSKLKKYFKIYPKTKLFAGLLNYHKWIIKKKFFPISKTINW